MMSEAGFQVVTEIRGARPDFLTYPLLPDDLIVQDETGIWWKLCPGIGIGGFVLTDEQVASLKPVVYEQRHLDFRIIDSEAVTS